MYLNRISHIRPRGTRFIQLHSRDRKVFDEWIRDKYRMRTTGYSVTSAITGIVSYNTVAVTPNSSFLESPRYRHAISQLGVGTISAILWPFFLPTNIVFLTATFISDISSNDLNPSNQSSL